MTYFDSHPELDALELCLLDRLDEMETQVVKDHLMVCGPCRLMTEALENEIQLLRSAFQ